MPITTAPTITIRAIVPDDCQELARFYERLSTDSLELRFHGGSPRLSAGAARFFCGPDHAAREGLVAEVLEDDGSTTIVGHLCLEPLGPVRPGVAEVAVAVADEWQRCGIGRALIAAAVEWAANHGIDRLEASLLWGNAAMLGLIRSIGYPVSYGAPDAGTIEATVDIRAAAAPHAA
jgi:acetyltransferase